MLSASIRDIDHLLTFVSALDTASAAYERLGFTLTPISNIAAMGITNRLIVLQPRTAGVANFIELMAVTDAARLPSQMQRILAGLEGTKSLVLATTDVAKSREHFLSLGYEFAAPVHVRREWKISAGVSVFPEFNVLMPAIAPLVFNACQYADVGVYLRKEWQAHPNSAITLDAAFCVSEEPAELANAYAKIMQCRVAITASGAYRLTPGRMALEIYDPRQFKYAHGTSQPGSEATGYAGYRILVCDVALCRDVIAGNGVPVRWHDDVCVVDPQHGLGHTIVFAQ